ncbi:GNAT family N-acetyltransferase [Fibrobacter sp. UWOV1]
MRPEYQGQSIGRELVERVKEIYKDYQLVDVGSFFTQ